MVFSQTVRDLVSNLERDFPAYQSWVVPLATAPGYLWCARPWDDERAEYVVNEQSEPDLRATLTRLITPEGDQ